MGKDHELLEAARIGNQNLLEKLLSPKAKSTTRTLAASIGIKVGPNVNCQDQSGYSPLHHASLNGHKDSVCFLLQNSASANVSDIKGNFPLHLASWSGSSEIVKCLLTYGPSIARVNEQNGDKETALHCAAQHGHTDTVKVLLKHAADPNLRNVRDESPLDLASQYGRLHVVRLILHFQPSLLSQSSERYTPLHLASRNGHKEVVEMLLAHGADINKTGENGSALHEAALFGKPEVVRLLLSRGANPHTLDPKSRTAMELVRQLNTQTSREISQLILSRLQDGEDYEPISPSPADSTSTPSSLRRVQSQATVVESPHTYLDMQRGEAVAFLERGYSSKNVFETPAPSLVSLPRVTVEDHYISPQLRRASNTSSPHSTEGSKGFGGSWGRSSFGKGIMLRRSASARSSRSLPRLPSASGRSPSTSVLLADPNHSASSALFRQHHPSSNMFPVSPASHLKPSDPARRASASLPSSPLLPSPLHSSPLPASQIKEEEEENEEGESRAKKKIFTRERLKTEDDNVFLPGPTRKAKAARSRRVQSYDPHDSPVVTRFDEPGRMSESRPPEESADCASAEPGTPGRSPPGSRPKKPARARSKFSTPMTPMTPMTPPPIPPKPMSMMKVRPPSPVDPPPEDEEVDEEEEDMASLNPEDGDQSDEEQEENKENVDRSLSHSSTAGDAAAAALQKLRRSLVLPTGGNLKGRTSNRGSSSTDAQSPLFSPPSPHTAMIQISEALQKAVSQENLITTSTANDEATLSDDTSHSVSSYHSTSTSSDSEDDVISKSMQKRRLTTAPGPPTHARSSSQQNMQANSDQKQSAELTTNDQSHAATSSTFFPQEAVAPNGAKSPPEAPVPAKRHKPPVPNKPTVKKRLSLYEANHAVLTRPEPPLVAPRKPPTLNDDGPDDVTVLDSQACYVTSGAVVKQARILSTRSSGSQPSSPMSLTYADKRQRDDAAVFDESNPAHSAAVDTLCNAQSATTPSESWAPTSGSPHNRTDPPRIESHLPRRQVDFVGTRNLSRGSLDSDDVGLDETKSTADEWDDSLSVRTEDLEMPKEVRKFRGLIRGASYRGRSKSRYVSSQKATAQDDNDQYVYDDSPYQSDSDSDCYGDKQDEHNINEGRILESRATPALIRDHVPPPAKLAAAKPMMTLEGVAKRASPGSLDLVMSGARYPGNNAAMQGRRDLRRKRTPGRSDGDDSPLSSPTSSAEEFDARLAKDTSTPRLPKTREGSKLRLSQHIRQHSYYDNNNNSNSNGTKSPASSPERDPEVAGSNRLPDLDQIVDTVTAVRSRSQGNSSSDPASGSSASSTLAKPQASMSAPPPGANQEQGGAEVDENEEWAQIASIMSSIGGGLNKGPVYAKEFEETFWKIMTGSELPRQISTWLAELGLPQYEKVLCGNGFDDVDFLAGDILEEQDLVDMDIRDASHRRRLLESAQNLPRIHPLVAPDNDAAPSSVEEWLASLHLPQYEAAFVAAGFDTMQFVRLMGDLEIRPLVGKRGHYKRIKASLLSKSGEESKPTAIRSARSRASSHGATRASPPLSRSPLLDSANFFKDYSNIVKSRAAATATGSSGTRSNDDDRSPAFHSGTVSSTGSGSSSVAADCHPHPLASDTCQRPVIRQQPLPVRSQKSKDEAPPRVPLPSDLPTSEQLVTSSASAHRSSSSSRHHVHRRKSSRDSEHAAKPRSRSGSHSSRTRRPELSVFVEKVPSSSSPSSPPHKEKSGRSSSHRHRSHHKSSSSIRSVDSERKETLRMSGKPTNVFDIPDIHRAIFLASEASPGGGAGGTGGLNLRPPNEATAEVSVHSWRHSADTLITTCCNYQAYYLGSMLVPELKGVESTVEACAKMRRSTDSMKKIPTIVLSINYMGVKFIDSKSKHEIAEHEICNISFASQDSEDLATFAYITHDVRTGHHYCHVFRVTTMDMAYEIILTLGQAFEVAYQLILKDKALKESEAAT